MSEEKHNLQDTILQKIEDDAIQPKSKWSFLLKEYLIWVLGGLSIVIGSLSVSIIYFIIRNSDWDIYEHLTESGVGFFISSIPYLWLLVLAGFIWLAHYQVKHTKHGYKYPILALLLFVIGASTFGGAVLTKANVGRFVHAQLNEYSEFYRDHADPKMRRWRHPMKGRVAGIVEHIDDDYLELEDDDDREWKVLLPQNPIFNEYQPDEDERIRVFGKLIDEDTIEAKQILPWDLSDEWIEQLRKQDRETKPKPLRTRE